jgi:uncharacterized membrane protein
MPVVITKHAKLITAIIGLALVVFTPDYLGDQTWIPQALAILTAIGVYQVPNTG